MSMAVQILFGAPPSPALGYDENREREEELGMLTLRDEELSADIEELSVREGSGEAWETTAALRRELLYERRQIRVRMLAIAHH